MNEEEARLHFKRLWREYTDRVLTRCRHIDKDAAIATLIQEAQNAQEHSKQVAAEVLRRCPDLTPAALVEIINKQIPVKRIK